MENISRTFSASTNIMIWKTLSHLHLKNQGACMVLSFVYESHKTVLFHNVILFGKKYFYTKIA